jgi:hypothetical protein
MNSWVVAKTTIEVVVEENVPRPVEVEDHRPVLNARILKNQDISPNQRLLKVQLKRRLPQLRLLQLYTYRCLYHQLQMSLRSQISQL